MANATDPATSVLTPSPIANETAAAGEMASPGSFAPTTPVAHATSARRAMAMPTAAACPATFSSAIDRLGRGVATAKSRLPRRASPARTDDRARMDHRPASRAKYAP